MHFASGSLNYRPLGTYKGFTLKASFHPVVVGTATSQFQIRVERTDTGAHPDSFVVTAQGTRSAFGDVDIEATARILMGEALAETRRMIDRGDFRVGKDHIINYRP